MTTFCCNVKFSPHNHLWLCCVVKLSNMMLYILWLQLLIVVMWLMQHFHLSCDLSLCLSGSCSLHAYFMIVHKQDKNNARKPSYFAASEDKSISFIVTLSPNQDAEAGQAIAQLSSSLQLYKNKNKKHAGWFLGSFASLHTTCFGRKPASAGILYFIGPYRSNTVMPKPHSKDSNPLHLHFIDISLFS